MFSYPSILERRKGVRGISDKLLHCGPFPSRPATATMTTPVSELQDLLATAERAALAAGDVLRDWETRFTVSEKGRADLVTEADVAAQRVFTI